MHRLCEVDDVIKGPFRIWESHDTQWGPSWDQSEGPSLYASEWLVVAVIMTGGGCGHGPHDVFPDGHRVTAVMLSPDGKTLREPGRVARFYQSGCFTGIIEPSQIEHCGMFGHATEKQRIK